MFSTLDMAAETVGRPKTTADRACDNCKARKVRCDMSRPCEVCIKRGFKCTYAQPRKKRGPEGKRIREIRHFQSQSSNGGSETQEHQSLDGYAHLDDTTTTRSPTYDDSVNLQLGTIASSNEFMDLGQTQTSPQLPYWTTDPTVQTETLQYAPSYPDMSSDLQRTRTSTTNFSDMAEPVMDPLLVSPSTSEFVFPSLPIESPSDSWDPFGAIPQQDLAPVAASTDVWPSNINEDTLLPWIDVYFKRLHPTVPILDRASMYREMLLRKHRTDSQYGAMLLGLCAFAMTQPVQIHERASTPSRSAQARMLMEECVKMRVAADFGEYPSIEMVLASFFLFACLFGNSQHKAARLRLREAVDLAHSLGLHLPQSYDTLEADTREQWLRTYLVLSVTERAYALQRKHSIDFRGRPGITARFMQAFDPSAATAYISSLIFQDQSDAVGMTGLLYLMESFDAIDENIIDCWNGHCQYSDGACESFDRRRGLQMFRAQQRAREASLMGNISFVPSASPLPLSELMESQQADISVTQYWLLNRLWNLCLSHGLLKEASDHPELKYDYACQIAHGLAVSCSKLPLAAMEVHGVGLVEKIHDVGMGIITAISSSVGLTLDAKPLPADSEPVVRPSARELLQALNKLIQDFRGGDHPYSGSFSVALLTAVGSDG